MEVILTRLIKQWLFRTCLKYSRLKIIRYRDRKSKELIMVNKNRESEKKIVAIVSSVKDAMGAQMFTQMARETTDVSLMIAIFFC